MPGFDIVNRVEVFMRTGTFPSDASKTSKKVTRAASKHFIYKDGCLWRKYRGRLLNVVRSDEEVREIMTRYHENNDHAGRVKMVKQIMSMYYWVGVTEAVKIWIKACPVCEGRSTAEPQPPPVHFCLAYGCDSSSYVHTQLSFHRFPKEPERRRRWLAVAQRDEGSLRTNSYLCSRHFEPSCFTLKDGQLALTQDAVPTIIPVTAQEEEVTDKDFLHPTTLEDLISTSAASEITETSAFESSETSTQLLEHQYCLPSSDPESRSFHTERENRKRKSPIEPSFTVYNHIARYLSHRILPMHSKKSRFTLKRMSKRFTLIDGVLMYARVSPPVRVPRSREEVNSILQQFHDNQGHYGHGICQRAITKHFYWANLSRDLARWISNCLTCVNKTKRKWLRCSVYNCTNCCGPVERGLGLTFHKFPLHNPALLAQWLKNVGRSSWHPRLWSSVCSAHFTDDCFDRSADKAALCPDAVPSLFVYSDPGAQSRSSAHPAVVEEVGTQEQIYFAKYDAVELYLRRRTYPPGLSYVEKNTFRRFCKNFTIKDDQLHMVRGDRVRLVLRNRQQVEGAMVDYHNELNHLDVNKCLRLLNERFFWKTMRPDVVRWIESCLQCSRNRKKKTEEQSEPGGPQPLLEALGSPQIHNDVDSENEDYGDEDNEDGGSDGDEEQQSVLHCRDRMPVTTIIPQTRDHNSQPRIPILIHLKPPIKAHSRTAFIPQPRAPNSPIMARFWPLRSVPIQTFNPQQSQIQETNCSHVQLEDQPEEEEAQSQVQTEANSCQNLQGSARTHVKLKDVPKQPNNQTRLKTKLSQEAAESQLRPPSPDSETQPRPSQPQGRRRSQRSLKKRKRSDPEVDPPVKKSASSGLEPVEAPSTKQWPIFTFAGSASSQTTKPCPKADSRKPSHQW
ncbi:uncharacterized protein LOC142995593 isoform X2 [Genypterus blacodes]|uniref:uncharacterized protein LOC142995593 isoform X2 n=1 Tax=Genypterus blacodes TaxID=154954 RepID=UPI003F761902